MPFTPKTPYLTTDAIIEVYIENKFEGIVIIQRKNPPLGLALPGGFVDRGESVENACKREMREETNLDIKITSLLGVYSDPSRDPRFHTASVVFIAKATSYPQAGDDAKKTILIKPDKINLEQMVFDHGQILQDYLTHLSNIQK